MTKVCSFGSIRKITSNEIQGSSFLLPNGITFKVYISSLFGFYGLLYFPILHMNDVNKINLINPCLSRTFKNNSSQHRL